MRTWPTKDPEEVLDYGFNWTPRNIGEDLITATTAQVIAGDVVVDDHSVGVVVDPETPCKAGQGTVTVLSGGTTGTQCQVKLHAITSSGRELEETLKIKIKDR